MQPNHLSPRQKETKASLNPLNKVTFGYLFSQDPPPNAFADATNNVQTTGSIFAISHNWSATAAHQWSKSTDAAYKSRGTRHREVTP